MRKICCFVMVLLLLIFASGCKQNEKESVTQNNVCAFVQEIKDNIIIVDVAEYITTEDAERIAELKLSDKDMISGYYINNTEIETNNQRINNNGLIVTDNVYIPKVKEIRIPVPKAESKKQITPLPQKKEFIF